MARVTYRELESMRGDGELHLIHWPTVPGLYFQITPAGSKSWVVRGRLNGKPVLRTLGSFAGYKLALVEEDGRVTKGLIDKGIDPAATPEPDESPTFKILWDLYERVEGPKRVPDYLKKQREFYFRCIHPSWGNAPANKVDGGMANRLLDTFSPSIANRVMDVIISLTKLGKLYYPHAGITFSTEGRKRAVLKTRTRVLSAEELTKVGQAWKQTKRVDKLMFMFLLLTGARCGVCVSYDPKWLKGPDRMEFPEKTVGLKGARFVVIPKVAQPLVSKFGPTDLSRMEKFCKHIAKKADIPKFSTHDLRRTFATSGVDINESDDQINALLNHMPSKVTQSYLMRNIPPLVPVAERISQYIYTKLGIDFSDYVLHSRLPPKSVKSPHGNPVSIQAPPVALGDQPYITKAGKPVRAPRPKPKNADSSASRDKK